MARRTEAPPSNVGLGQSIERYRRIFGALDDRVMVLDADHVVMVMNGKLADLLEYSASMLAGQRLSKLIIEDSIREPGGWRWAGPAIDTAGREIRLRAADGSYRWAHLQATPLFNKEGQYCGVRARAIDITALKSVEGEVARLNEELESGDAVPEEQMPERLVHLEDFVATVSRKVHTPLTSVRGYVDFMMSDQGLPGEEQKRYLDWLVANPLDMANLVNNLLDLSHAAHGRLDLDGRPVALSALLEQLQDAIAPDFDDKGGSQSNRAPSWRGPRSTSKLRRRSSDSLAS